MLKTILYLLLAPLYVPLMLISYWLTNWYEDVVEKKAGLVEVMAWILLTPIYIPTQFFLKHTQGWWEKLLEKDS